MLSIKSKFQNTDGRSKKMYKNTAAMMLLKGASILISLMTAPIMLHHVNRADYGVLLTLTSIVSWVGMMDVGLGNGLRNRLPEMLAKGDLQEAKKAISSSYATLAIYVGLLISAFLIASPFIDWLNILNSPKSDAEETNGLAMVVFIAFCLQFLLGLIVSILYVNPAKRNVLDLKNETCKNREKRNVLKISHTRHFKTTKSSPKRAAFIVLNGKQTAFK